MCSRVQKYWEWQKFWFSQLGCMVAICIEVKIWRNADYKRVSHSTIYWIIKNFMESGSIAIKASGHKRKSSKCQKHLLKSVQLCDSQQEQSSGMAEYRCECIWTRNLLKHDLVNIYIIKKWNQEATSLQENLQGQFDILRRYMDWTAEDWGYFVIIIIKLFCPIMFHQTSNILEYLATIVQRRKGQHYHESCFMPTVKHIVIFVWLLLILVRVFASNFALQHCHDKGMISRLPLSPIFQPGAKSKTCLWMWAKPKMVIDLKIPRDHWTLTAHLWRSSSASTPAPSLRKLSSNSTCWGDCRTGEPSRASWVTASQSG